MCAAEELVNTVRGLTEDVSLKTFTAKDLHQNETRLES